MSKKTELVEEIGALELAGKPDATEADRDALVRKYRKMKLAELEAVHAEQSQRLADAAADLVEEEPALDPLPPETVEELPDPKVEFSTPAPSVVPSTPAPTSGVCTVVISGAVFNVPVF